jgi:cyclic beta-1,2-glucan synthetase
MYRAGLESMLGLRRRGDTFFVDPCIPAAWPAFTVTWRVQRTTYVVSVLNPGKQSRGVRSASLDGQAVDAGAIPIVDDGLTHQVRIVLGPAP